MYSLSLSLSMTTESNSPRTLSFDDAYTIIYIYIGQQVKDDMLRLPVLLYTHTLHGTMDTTSIDKMTDE